MESEVQKFERSVAEYRGKKLPVNLVGHTLNDATRLYLRQLPPSKRGPMVAMSEVIEPFDDALRARLENVIATLEAAFNGENPDEESLKYWSLVRIPENN